VRKQQKLLYFVLLSGLASLLNYSTYPILARALPEKQFIGITVALSLLTQMTSFLSSIVALSVGLAKQDDEQSSGMIEKLQAVLMQMFLVVIVIFLAASPYLLNTIKLSAAFLLPICMLLLFSIPISIISGFLNGKHKLIKLALTAIISSVLQFVLTIAIGFSTENGALALGGMALGQFLAIFSIYWVYRSDKLPHINTVFKYRLASFRTPQMKSLIKFTVVSSIGIMVINILQIIDLLIVQNRQIDAKLYTDLYIISRVVFFAGTIFIWPFLSAVNIYQTKQNVGVFGRLVGILTLLSAGAIGGILLFGQQITKILFGTTYDPHVINQLGVLAITYKYGFLLITALTLYFIVIRKYWAAVLPAILTFATFLFAIMLDKSYSTLQVLYGLNAIAALGLVCGLIFFIASIKTTGEKATAQITN
jgi:O-antigen/teichoic acid export membrane protein